MALENTPPLRLNREQLGTFLKDHRTIKAFENLFGVVESIAPDLVQQALLQAGTAQAAATQALAKIDQAIQESAIASATADAKATQALNSLQNIVQDAALLWGAADNKAAQALQTIEQLKTAIEMSEQLQHLFRQSAHAMGLFLTPLHKPQLPSTRPMQ